MQAGRSEEFVDGAMENLEMSIEAYMVLLDEGGRAGNLAFVEKAGMCGMDGARMCQSFVSLICVNFDVWIARRGGEICENSLHGSSASPRRRIYQVLHDSCLKEAILLYT